MTTYKCGKFTVTMLHYGNKQVFCRGEDGDEYRVDREFFDGSYVKDDAVFNKSQSRKIAEAAIRLTRNDKYLKW